MNTLFSTTEFVGQMDNQNFRNANRKSATNKNTRWTNWFKNRANRK